MVHRRYGQGQLLSIGVTGLWRWAFNAKIEGVNTLYDRFWTKWRSGSSLPRILYRPVNLPLGPVRQYFVRRENPFPSAHEKHPYASACHSSRAV